MDRTVEMLEEMDRAGVVLIIYSSSFYRSYGKYKWGLEAKKESEGVSLKIVSYGDSLAEATEEIYDKWITATKGLPEHGLRQIEATPQAAPQATDWEKELNDEIPF